MNAEEFSQAFKKLLTKQDVCNITGVTLRTVNRWLKKGMIPYLKLERTVRFCPEDVEKFISGSRITKSQDE